MDNNKFQHHCKSVVLEYLNNDPSIECTVTENDIYIVWCCKTLQNNKALVSANISGCPYFEITYNGDKNELYVDVYKKESNHCILVP